MMRDKGFSLIEMIVAITLITIVMIPVSVIAMEYVRAIAYSDSLTMASNLARREMAIIDNLDYADPTLAIGYNSTTQNYAGYPYDLARTVFAVPPNNPVLKQVRVRLFRCGSTEQLIEINNYKGRYLWGAGSAGGALGDEKDSFFASNGVFSNQGRRLTLAVTNTRDTGNITIKAIIFKPSIARTLSSIAAGGETKFSGSLSLPANQTTRVDLQRNFFLSRSGITYSFVINFSGGASPSYTLEAIFVFYDDTQCVTYAWPYVK